MRVLFLSLLGLILACSLCCRIPRRGDVSFRPIRVEPCLGFKDHFTVCLEFTNNTRQPISLPSLYPNAEDPVYAYDVRHAVLKGSRWVEYGTRHPTCMSVPGPRVVVGRGEKRTVRIYSVLPRGASLPFEARVVLSGYTSEPFTVRPEDLSEAKQAGVREAHLTRVRAKLRKSGFRRQVVEAEDPGRALLGAMLDLPFESYGVRLPADEFSGIWVLPDGRMTLRITETVESRERGYGFYCDLKWDGDNLDLGLVRHTRKEAHVMFHSDSADARHTIWMGFEFLDDEGNLLLGFGVDYFTFREEPLPDRETFERLYNQILDNLEGCFDDPAVGRAPGSGQQ